MTEPWQPSATLEQIRTRARLLQNIRAFFHERGVLEVETPILSHAGNTDPHLESFATRYGTPGAGQRLYLHTSPEFAMKRLLCAGSGDIYQVCKVFRNDELGRLHNPEFTMLEWYRLGMDHHALMREVEQLMRVLGLLPEGESIPCYSYRELFRKFAGIDPLEAGVPELRQYALDNALSIPGSMLEEPEDRQCSDTWLDLILTQKIEISLRDHGLVFVYDYPVSQAALSHIRDDDPPVAERFELYASGVELANGFHELQDAREQRARFERDLEARKVLGLESIPIDTRLLEALEQGLPDCAGVALGLDRILILLSQKRSVGEVISFEFVRA